MEISGPSNYRAVEIEKFFDEFGMREWDRLLETIVQYIISCVMLKDRVILAF